jgi:hypothetical protein
MKDTPKPPPSPAGKTQDPDGKYDRYKYRCKALGIKSEAPYGKFIEWVEENHPELMDENYVPTSLKGVPVKERKKLKKAPIKLKKFEEAAAEVKPASIDTPAPVLSQRSFEVLQVKVGFSLPEFREVCTALKQNGGRALAEELEQLIR